MLEQNLAPLGTLSCGQVQRLDCSDRDDEIHQWCKHSAKDSSLQGFHPVGKIWKFIIYIYSIHIVYIYSIYYIYL